MHLLGEIMVRRPIHFYKIQPAKEGELVVSVRTKEYRIPRRSAEGMSELRLTIMRNSPLYLERVRKDFISWERRQRITTSTLRCVECATSCLHSASYDSVEVSRASTQSE